MKSFDYHYLWIIPLAIFASPLGVLIAVKVAPEYWIVPFCAMCLAVCALAYPEKDDTF